MNSLRRGDEKTGWAELGWGLAVGDDFSLVRLPRHMTRTGSGLVVKCSAFLPSFFTPFFLSFLLVYSIGIH